MSDSKVTDKSDRSEDGIVTRRQAIEQLTQTVVNQYPKDGDVGVQKHIHKDLEDETETGLPVEDETKDNIDEEDLPEGMFDDIPPASDSGKEVPTLDGTDPLDSISEDIKTEEAIPEKRITIVMFKEHKKPPEIEFMHLIDDDKTYFTRMDLRRLERYVLKAYREYKKVLMIEMDKRKAAEELAKKEA